MTLDMRHRLANDVLQRLMPSVDVIVENARPGAMEARGFGYSHARAANPGVIWCAITGFGQTGPYAEYSGHDLSYLAHSGLLGAMSESQPWHPAIPLALQAGAFSAVVAIQAALLQRTRSGQGSFVDVSLSEAATWFLSCGIRPLSDRPLALPATPDRRLYACADGRYVAVACAEPRTWGVLCDGLGVPELKPNLLNPEPAAATTAAIAAVFLTRAAKEWVAFLAPFGAAVRITRRNCSTIRRFARAVRSWKPQELRCPPRLFGWSRPTGLKLARTRRPRTRWVRTVTPYWRRRDSLPKRSSVSRRRA